MSWFIASQPHEMLSSFLTHHRICNWLGSEVQPFRLQEKSDSFLQTSEQLM